MKESGEKTSELPEEETIMASLTDISSQKPDLVVPCILESIKNASEGNGSISNSVGYSESKVEKSKTPLHGKEVSATKSTLPTVRRSGRRKVAKLGHERDIINHTFQDIKESSATKSTLPTVRRSGRRKVAEICSEQNRLLQSRFDEVGNEGDIINSTFKDVVSRRGLLSLRPRTWVNDEVINFVMSLLQKHDNEFSQSGKKSHFFTSFFLTKLLMDKKEYCYDYVKRWSRNVFAGDVFTLDKIFFPVHVSNTHWALVVAHMNKKEIHYYCSLGNSGKKWVNGVFKYLQDEHMNKTGKKMPNLDEWKLIYFMKCPKQKNGFDCGVYACIMAYKIFVGMPLTFDQRHVDWVREQIALSIIQTNQLW
jgi:sentrin-specific protease 1